MLLWVVHHLLFDELTHSMREPIIYSVLIIDQSENLPKISKKQLDHQVLYEILHYEHNEELQLDSMH